MKQVRFLTTHLFRGAPVKRINNRDTFWEQQVTSSAHTFFLLHLAYSRGGSIRFDYLSGSFFLSSAVYVLIAR